MKAIEYDELGELKKVNIRKFWKHEAQDFTPWLAQEENVQQLGASLGLELEVENTEVSVGPYSADILAKDIGTGKYIVIENQLEKTNHDHLGKSITYASVLNASAIIWIASQFTEEHQKALDWLNDHTNGEVGFYGVVLELWAIDNSKPAVRFNVISRPVEIIRKAAKYKASENLSETRKIQLDFWIEFSNKLIKTKKVPSVQSPRPQYWFDVSLGKSGINLSNTANVSAKKIGVRVYIHNKIADAALEQLEPQKDQIEKEIGTSLLWNPNPANKDKIIVIYHDADLYEKNKWNGYIEWLVDMNLKFIKAFKPRIKKLNLKF